MHYGIAEKFIFFSKHLSKPQLSSRYKFNLIPEIKMLNYEQNSTVNLEKEPNLSHAIFFNVIVIFS